MCRMRIVHMAFISPSVIQALDSRKSKGQNEMWLKNYVKLFYMKHKILVIPFYSHWMIYNSTLFCNWKFHEKYCMLFLFEIKFMLPGEQCLFLGFKMEPAGLIKGIFQIFSLTDFQITHSFLWQTTYIENRIYVVVWNKEFWAFIDKKVWFY